MPDSSQPVDPGIQRRRNSLILLIIFGIIVLLLIINAQQPWVESLAVMVAVILLMLFIRSKLEKKAMRDRAEKAKKAESGDPSGEQ